MDPNSDLEIIKLLSQLKGDPESLPRESFRTNARIRLLNLITPRALVPVLHPHPNFLHIFKSALAAATVSVAGLVIFAQVSRPGQLLFPVKIASEKIALSLAPKVLKTRVATDIIDRRAGEIKNSITGNSPLLREEIDNYEDTVESISKLRDVEQSEVNEHVDSHAPLLLEAGKKKTEDDVKGAETKRRIKSPGHRSEPGEQKEIDEKETLPGISGFTVTPLATVSPLPTEKPEPGSEVLREGHE